MEPSGLPRPFKTLSPTIKKILYLQFTNPGGYPPLEHSSRILAESGWRVVFLGTGARGAGNLEFPAHPNIRVKRWRFVEGGVLQKIHYILFGLWCFGLALLWRPNWIYASDPLICPIALCIQRITRVRLVYHEHDSPEVGDKGEGIKGLKKEFSQSRKERQKGDI